MIKYIHALVGNADYFYAGIGSDVKN